MFSFESYVRLYEISDIRTVIAAGPEGCWSIWCSSRCVYVIAMQ